LQDKDFKKFELGKCIKSDHFSIGSVKDMRISFYPQGTLNSNGNPRVSLCGPNIFVQANILLDGALLSEKCAWKNLQISRLSVNAPTQCKAHYSSITIRVERSAAPILAWALPSEELRSLEKGTCITSEPFSVQGLQCKLQVDFYPAGSILAQNDRVSAYLHVDTTDSVSGREGKPNACSLWLAVDGISRRLSMKTLTDSCGWTDFTKQGTKQKYIHVFCAEACDPGGIAAAYIGCQIYSTQSAEHKLSLLDAAASQSDLPSLIRALNSLARDRGKRIQQRAADMLPALLSTQSLLAARDRLAARARDAEASLRAALRRPVAWALSAIVPPPGPVPAHSSVELRVVLRDAAGEPITCPHVARAVAAELRAYSTSSSAAAVADGGGGGDDGKDAGCDIGGGARFFETAGGEVALHLRVAAPVHATVRVRVGDDAAAFAVGPPVDLDVRARRPHALTLLHAAVSANANSRAAGAGESKEVLAGALWVARVRVTDNFGAAWRCPPSALRLRARPAGAAGPDFQVAVSAAAVGLGKRPRGGSSSSSSLSSSEAAAADEFVVTLDTYGLPGGPYELRAAVAGADAEVRSEGAAVEVLGRDPGRWTGGEAAAFVRRRLPAGDSGELDALVDTDGAEVDGGRLLARGRQWLAGWVRRSWRSGAGESLMKWAEQVAAAAVACNLFCIRHCVRPPPPLCFVPCIVFGFNYANSRHRRWVSDYTQRTLTRYRQYNMI
jgi:hypothetical protein